MADAAPGWLVAEVSDGLQRLVVLRLEGAPAADALEAVAMVWAEALMARGRWDRQVDAPRIRQGFRSLAAHTVRWPAPAQLWEHLPPRPERPRLNAPPPSAEQRARIRALLQQARQNLIR